MCYDILAESPGLTAREVQVKARAAGHNWEVKVINASLYAMEKVLGRSRPPPVRPSFCRTCPRAHASPHPPCVVSQFVRLSVSIPVPVPSRCLPLHLRPCRYPSMPSLFVVRSQPPGQTISDHREMYSFDSTETHLDPLLAYPLPWGMGWGGVLLPQPM